MTDYEAKIAHAMIAQFGPHWFLHGAHPQTVLDFLKASDEPSRERARSTMRRDAINYASNCINAGLAAGIVAMPAES